jgi:carbon catabolite-derepressing protein kinase
LLSPAALSPTGGDVEVNPFESEFNGYDDEEDDEFDFSTPTPDEREQEHNNFAVLNSSLPDQFPEQHHLASYASARRAWPVAKEKKQHRTKWHFGIRSRSPPMEVMLEIYRTLKTLGMEWREKKNLGGLGSGSIHLNGNHGGRRRNGHGKIERVREYDGGGHVDLKAAASVYFIETRVRVQDIVVRCVPSPRYVPPDKEVGSIGPHEPSVIYGGLD